MLGASGRLLLTGQSRKGNPKSGLGFSGGLKVGETFPKSVGSREGERIRKSPEWIIKFSIRIH